jgi:two-component system, sensor histidine kinase ChiS
MFIKLILLFFACSLCSLVAEPMFILDQKQESIYLVGKWKFLPNAKPISLKEEPNQKDWIDSSIPSFWRDIGLMGTKRGWYFCSIYISENLENTNLGLISGGFLGAQEIYFNGKLIGKSGQINSENSVVQGAPDYYLIPKKSVLLNQYNFIYIHVADDLNVGGFPDPFIFGEYENIKRTFRKNSFIKSGILFSTLLFGLFFLFLFLGFIRDWSYFIYAINQILFGIFILGITRLVYWFTDGYYIYYYFVNLPLLIMSPLFAIFGFNFFKVQPNILDKFIILSSIPFIIIGTLIPIGLNPDLFFFRNTYFHKFQLYWYLLFFIPYIKILILAIHKREHGYKILILSVLYLLGLVIFTIVSFSKSKPLFWEGFLVFLLILNYLVAIRHSHFQKKLISMERHFKENLQIEVNEKTQVLEKTNKELRKATQTREKLFSIISQDLRTPLLSLQNLIKLAKKNEVNQSDWFFFISNLSNDLERNQFILDNLLHWTSIHLSRKSLQKENIELHQVIKLSTRALEIPIKEKEIQIEYEPIFVNIYSNSDSIKITIVNLLSNAIKFSKPKSTIIIQVKEKQDKVWVSILDFGIGLHDDSKKYIFEFNKSKIRNGTNQEKGTGLGLIVVKDILDALEEEIIYEKQIPSGCKFSFSIQKQRA